MAAAGPATTVNLIARSGGKNQRRPFRERLHG
jgi:hypothetical protein